MLDELVAKTSSSHCELFCSTCLKQQNRQMDLSIKSLSQKWQLYPFTYQGSNFTLLGNFTTYCFSPNPKNVDTTDAEMPKKFSRLVILAVLSTMSTPPSNLKLRIGLSLASFTNYPQIDHSSKQTFANTTKYKQSFSSFLNFPNTHVYQLRVASLYKYEF